MGSEYPDSLRLAVASAAEQIERDLMMTAAGMEAHRLAAEYRWSGVDERAILEHLVFLVQEKHSERQRAPHSENSITNYDGFGRH